MSAFIFDSYAVAPEEGTISFTYRFEDGLAFTEVATFDGFQNAYNADVLDRAARLAFLVIGTSYAKTFPTPQTQLPFEIDAWTANFLNTVYQEGMSQFAFENSLKRSDLLHFIETGAQAPAVVYEGSGILALQSGGKDSLLMATLLEKSGQEMTPWYVSSAATHPEILDSFSHPLVTTVRTIDHGALRQAQANGARNGHVPVTYIVQSLALIQAILLGKNTVVVSIGHEGEEPHAHIDDLAVTHQWSKTWHAEQLFSEYVARYVSPNLRIGSPLRCVSELKIAELFVQNCWEKYGRSFSSCNVANYQQGANNSQLRWCGECPKCANSYVLFAPFVAPAELQALFGGEDLFTKELLQDTFKGLLGVDGVMKPFECVGEVDELRYAYHTAVQNGGYAPLPFDVPISHFDQAARYPAQEWVSALMQPAL